MYHSSHSSLPRLSADIGGTFTDVVLHANGTQYSTKILTDYLVPEHAIIKGMHIVCEKASIKPKTIKQVVHGTTLATNALIERRGAKTAFITTEGFRDVIEMRTESRFEQYDLNLKLPEPLLPRWQRYTLQERVDAKGNIAIAINHQEIDELIIQLRDANYDSIAIGFMHSYVNDTHEKIVHDAILTAMPNVMISISSEVSPQIREYERFNTVIANAYIKPQMKSYLARLKGRMAEEGVSCPIFLMHSGGGIIAVDHAAEFPVRLVESGPAGGAVFAAHIAAQHGLKKVLSFDMGGTTAKICLINDYTPKTARVFEVARSYRFKKGSGMPISIPVIDMVEIGAGGGSLAHIDSMNQIRVGPESAGSEPGPACYNKGGKKPAVTDADLVLGKLDAASFAGGAIPLKQTLSEHSLLQDIGTHLDMDALTTAFGIQEVVDENMANAARMHAIENGEDLSEYTMIAFGGAAPLHAARLCEKLHITNLLIPPGAGVGSAIGFLKAPFSFESNRSIYMSLDDFDVAAATILFNELKKDSTEFVLQCSNGASIFNEYKIYMRYKGQGWEIPVILNEEQALKPQMDVLKTLFENQYRNLFGRIVEGMDIEILVWSVNTSTEKEHITLIDKNSTKHPIKATITRDVFDSEQEKILPSHVINRHDMAAGHYIKGPAVITEDETTIIIPHSRDAFMHNDGCIELVLKKDKDI